MLLHLPVDIAADILGNWIGDLISLSSLDIACTNHAYRELFVDLLHHPNLVFRSLSVDPHPTYAYFWLSSSQFCGVLTWLYERQICIKEFRVHAGSIVAASHLSGKVCFPHIEALHFGGYCEISIPAGTIRAFMTLFPHATSLDFSLWESLDEDEITSFVTKLPNVSALTISKSSPISSHSIEVIANSTAQSLTSLQVSVHKNNALSYLLRCEQLRSLTLYIDPAYMDQAILYICHHGRFEHLSVGAIDGWPDETVTLTTADIIAIAKSNPMLCTLNLNFNVESYDILQELLLYCPHFSKLTASFGVWEIAPDRTSSLSITSSTVLPAILSDTYPLSLTGFHVYFGFMEDYCLQVIQRHGAALQQLTLQGRPDLASLSCCTNLSHLSLFATHQQHIKGSLPSSCLSTLQHLTIALASCTDNSTLSLLQRFSRCQELHQLDLHVGSNLSKSTLVDIILTFRTLRILALDMSVNRIDHMLAQELLEIATLFPHLELHLDRNSYLSVLNQARKSSQQELLHRIGSFEPEITLFQNRFILLDFHISS